jgi:hypothetical protein
MEKNENWPRIKAIVAEALERAPQERETFLSEARAADPLVRAEVKSLLSAYESSLGLSDTELTDLSQLRAFFGFFALIFMVKASVFSGSAPGSGRVETKCLPFDNALLAVCRWHVSA